MATLGEYLRDRFREAIRDGLADAQPELSAVAHEAGKAPADALSGTFGGGFSLGDLLPLVGLSTGGLGAFGSAFGALAAKAGEWVLSIASGWALGEFFSEALRPVWLEITHSINDALQSEIFDPNTAALLEAKGLISHDFGRSEAAGGNLAGDHYDKLALAAAEHPDVASLLTLLNLKALSDADVDNALQRHGIPSQYWGPLKELRRTLLSPADLALALLRGIIDETTATGYADQLGVTPADLAVLVGNTGEPPGPQELLEAYRRGFIDQPTLERGIRQSRIRNEWIPTVEKLRYEPPTTSDAVRAQVEGHISRDEAAAIADQNGLEPGAVDMLIASWGRPLSHEQMLTLYHRQQATLDEVKQAMRESDIKNKYIDQAVELGRRLVPERTIVSMLHNNVIDHATALTMLAEQGYNHADAERLVLLGAAQRRSTAKELSRADITSMYEDKLIAKSDAVSHLEKLGYTKGDADAMLQLADTKALISKRKTTQRAIEASVKAHHLSEKEAVTQLTNDGLDPRQAQGLVDQWLQQRGAAFRTLTEAQILKLGEQQFISGGDTLTRLKGLGLVEGDAQLLLRLHGIKTSQPATQ